MPTEAGNLALASAFLSGMSLLVLIVLLAIIVRLMRQEQMLETWISREFSRVHETLDSIRRQMQVIPMQGIPQAQVQPVMSQSPPAQPMQGQVVVTTQNPQLASGLPTSPPGAYPSSPSAYIQSPYAPPKRVPVAHTRDREKSPMPSEGREILRAVNELLSGNTPYNFEETLHAEHPRLNLMRMSPRGTPDPWSSVVLLDPGGEAYFALIDQNRAYLFPNYDRFSATHDPKPLFDGARQDARVQAINKPAVLNRMSDGAWQLTEKGRVEMR